jgi:predicted metal-dependent enzyme (double-stranded beta helix superfamily)
MESFDSSLMPYPIKPGVSQYIRECADLIEKNMREINEINKFVKQSLEEKKILVDQVIEAKKKMSNYLLTNNDQQTFLDQWIS